ncbi:MAG: hypothetical protein ABSF46_13555 [Terriglobia bacterium]|jgi:hypothetical protein
MLNRTHFEFKAPSVWLILSGLALVLAGAWRLAPVFAQLPSGTPVFNANAKWVTDRGSQVFNVKAYGAVCNGTSDDSTAIQAAINAANPTAATGYSGVGVILIPGGCAVANTLNMSAGILTGVGLGSTNNYGGSAYLRWIGASGKPMIQINGWSVSIRDIALIGNSTTPPSELIQINRLNGGIADHGEIVNVCINNCTQGTLTSASSTNGITWNGTVGGDSWRLQNVRINNCTANGINIQNGNASDIHFDNLMVSTSGVGFYALSQELYGTNWEFGGNTVDIQIGVGAELNIQGYACTGGCVEMLVNNGGMFTLDGGSFEEIAGTTAPYFIDDSQGNSTGTFTTIRNFRVFGTGSTQILQCPSATLNGQFVGGLKLDNVYGITPNMITCPLTWANATSTQTEAAIDYRPNQSSIESYYDPNLHELLTPWTGFTFDPTRNDRTLRNDFWSGPIVMQQVPQAQISATCTLTSGSGSTTYYYRVAAVTGAALGSTPEASLPDYALSPTEISCASQNATLSSAAMNRIRISPQLGVQAWLIGRSTTPGAEQPLATVPQNPVGQDAPPYIDYYDNGSATPSGAMPSSTNTTGALYFVSQGALGSSGATTTVNGKIDGSGNATLASVTLPNLTNTPVLGTNSAGQIVAGTAGSGTGTAGLNTVTCSSGACAMNASKGNVQSVSLAANGTGTLSNCAAGQQLTVMITEASGSGAGGYTWTWPSNMYGGGNIDPTAGAWNAQSFVCDASGNAWAAGPLRNAFNSAGGYLFLDFLNGSDGGSGGGTIGSPSSGIDKIVDGGFPNHPGTWELASGTVANAGYEWTLSNNNGSATDYTPNSSPSWTIEYVVYPTATTNWTLRFGALGGVTSNPPTSGAWIQLNTSVDGNWHCDSANGTNTQDQSSGVAVAANTWYRLRISQNPNTVTFWVNGVQVCQNTTYYPTSGPLFYEAQSISLSTTSNAVYMDSFAWSRGVAR